jgi:hypothetical protein
MTPALNAASMNATPLTPSVAAIPVLLLVFLPVVHGWPTNCSGAALSPHHIIQEHRYTVELGEKLAHLAARSSALRPRQKETRQMLRR